MRYSALAAITRPGLTEVEIAKASKDLVRRVAPVRFVKSIGDVVMFVCPDPAPLLDVALKLVEAVADTGAFDGSFAGARRLKGANSSGFAGGPAEPSRLGRPGATPGACNSVMRGCYAAGCVPHRPAL